MKLEDYVGSDEGGSCLVLEDDTQFVGCSSFTRGVSYTRFVNLQEEVIGLLRE
jgi:hypothetical protein